MGFAAHLFYEQMTDETTLRNDIEQRLATAEPDVELLACERIAAERLRLVIDHPEGVDLGLCERVTHHLRELLVNYGLEVSSPGPQRPLTKAEHFRRFIGRRARVRTREEREGQRNFTGELVGATDAEVTIAAPNGVVTVPLTEIEKGNLLEGEEG